MAGVLVIVGTPLGNREDLSPRARAAILGADLLLCEDTRSPVRLFGEGVELPPRRSCFVGNEHGRVDGLLEALAAGSRVVYVSEAGMPCWSDPGRLLVRAALDAGHEVDVVPGPTALATAVALSGLPSEHVRFVGFPPRGGKPRAELIEDLQHETATVVFYEAGNRTRELALDLAKALRDADVRELVVARELTKLHQQVVRGTVATIEAELPDPVLGEVTIVLGPASTPRGDVAREAARETLATVLDASLKPRERARRLAALTGLPARDLYAQLGAAGDNESE
jgi:16S rRNA (cytidine1402-2'-O)-methyltransferase